MICPCCKNENCPCHTKGIEEGRRRLAEYQRKYGVFTAFPEGEAPTPIEPKREQKEREVKK